MTSISYDDIFSYFLGGVTDYGIASLDTSDAVALMMEQLHKAVAEPYVRRLFSSIQLDDEIMTLTCEMKNVVDEVSDIEFVKLILSKGMIVEWIKPQVRSKINLSQYFGGKEQSFFSQANHIAELRGMLEDTQLDIKKSIRDRGYIYNSYLEGQ